MSLLLSLRTIASEITLLSINDPLRGSEVEYLKLFQKVVHIWGQAGNYTNHTVDGPKNDGGNSR